MNAIDWQSSVAIVVVVLTAGIFLWRAIRPKTSGCSTDCSCTPTKKTK
ncbi:hypothetical protein N9B57_01745 [Verrucomicrobia bacterium]|nr:hypothetical protein [Verrucomicrobiota bacterium]MDA7866635.1 hypothetical protein [Verrucomicrobiota bacterium]